MPSERGTIYQQLKKLTCFKTIEQKDRCISDLVYVPEILKLLTAPLADRERLYILDMAASRLIRLLQSFIHEIADGITIQKILYSYNELFSTYQLDLLRITKSPVLVQITSPDLMVPVVDIWFEVGNWRYKIGLTTTSAALYAIEPYAGKEISHAAIYHPEG